MTSMHRMVRGLCALSLFVFGLAVSSQTARAEAARYEIDPEHFSVGFLVHHIGFADTLGMFLEAEGSFVFDEESLQLSDVRVEVETESVFTNHKKRDKHLRSSDFLDSDEFEEMTFVGTGSEQTGPRSGKVTGNLTLRGQTRPLTLDVTWNKSDRYPFGHKDHVIGISARGSLKRSDFGMTYAVENGWVGDEIELIIEFEARRK